jgi:hypothetical protein
VSSCVWLNRSLSLICLPYTKCLLSVVNGAFLPSHVGGLGGRARLFARPGSFAFWFRVAKLVFILVLRLRRDRQGVHLQRAASISSSARCEVFVLGRQNSFRTGKVILFSGAPTSIMPPLTGSLLEPWGTCGFFHQIPTAQNNCFERLNHYGIHSPKLASFWLIWWTRCLAASCEVLHSGNKNGHLWRMAVVVVTA